MTAHCEFRRQLGIVVALCLLSLVHCGNDDTVGVNLALAAGLSRTSQIEIFALSVDGPSPYRRRALLTNPDEVRAWVDTLNEDVGLLPNTFCMPEYLLQFHRDDGGMEELGYLCSGQARLRWAGQEYEAPERFVERMQIYM